MGILNFIDSVCVQTAVYWAKNGRGFAPGKNYADAVEIKCRWDGQQQEVTDSKGEKVICNAKLLLTQNVTLDGYLYLGALADLDSDPQPEDIKGAYRILKVKTTPLFKSIDQFVYEAFLGYD